MTNEKQSKRVESLDAFRGIASFLIMVTHFLLHVPAICQGENMGLIYGALSWKLPYFFILSGYVLTLSYDRNRERLGRPYRSFLVSRILRIYPLFFISTLAMYAIKVIFSAGSDVEDASIFFNISWRMAPTISNLLHSLTLVGLENTWLYNGPAWTLVFEMRYAILFPIFLFLLRRSWLFVVPFVAAVFVGESISSGLESVDIFYKPEYVISNLCSMVGFLLFYVGGIILAVNRKRLSELYNSLPQWGVIVLFFAMLASVLNPLWLNYILPHSPLSSTIGNCIMAVGVMLWVLMLLNNTRLSALFSGKALVALGRSSFSIYMLHTPIITTLYMLLRESIGLGWIIAISVVATLILAQLSFRYIEQPIIAFSQRLRR